MSDAKVIAFPKRSAPKRSAPKPSSGSHPALSPRADGYRDWLSWAECELAILGYDFTACDYDWHAAHARGLRPEAAAAEAAQGH